MSQNPFYERPVEDGLGLTCWILAASAAGCFFIVMSAATVLLYRSISVYEGLAYAMLFCIAFSGLASLYAIIRWWSRA